MTALNKQALREAAEKATPGRIGDRIDGSGSIKYECHGYDGSLVLRTDHKNMEYGFIGDNGNADELFFRLCVPDVVLALLDELEAAQKRIAELEGLALENIRLKVGISGLIGLGLRYADADVMRLAGDAQQSTPTTDGIIENIAAGIGVKGE
ncbi:TPA: ead/Ea22-like family protein [Citrobacter freundii]|nr:ead/Ea22-like family protein [Citrobacter freundii]HBN5497873.1 ead/Ea22-like family protein [Citrobacter freundii]HBU9121874.1 ead/Ea22-like family protein [Citrobacter freundii]